MNNLYVTRCHQMSCQCSFVIICHHDIDIDSDFRYLAGGHVFYCLSYHIWVGLFCCLALVTPEFWMILQGNIICWSVYLPLIITFQTNFEFPALSIIFAEWWKKMVMGVYLSAWFGQTVVWPGIFILRFCDYCWSNTKYQFKPTHFQSNCSWLGQCHPVSFIIWILLHCY